MICAVRKSFMEISAFNFNEFAWSELLDPEAQLAGAADALQTPGAVSTRLFREDTKNCKVTKKRRDALIRAWLTSWGVQRRKFGSCSRVLSILDISFWVCVSSFLP